MGEGGLQVNNSANGRPDPGVLYMILYIKAKGCLKD